MDPTDEPKNEPRNDGGTASMLRVMDAQQAAAQGFEERGGYIVKVFPCEMGKIIEVVAGNATISFEITEANISTFCDFLNDR